MRRAGERYVLSGGDKIELVWQGALTGAGVSFWAQFLFGLPPIEHTILWMLWWAAVGGLARLQIAVSANPPD